MNKNEEYNQRQLRLMLEKIYLYRNKKIELEILLNEINSLLNFLNNKDTEWIDKFIILSNKIDYLYLNFNDDNLSDDIRKKEKFNIDKYLIELDNLIKQKIIKNN